MRATLSLDGKVGYVYLTDRRDIAVAESIELDNLQLDLEGVSAPSLVLDFDAEGRLLGIEVFEATSALPTDLLAQAHRS